MRAVWNGSVLAESDETVLVEGNHYFPSESLNTAHFALSQHTSRCPWKGTASYYDVEAGGERNENAAWTYPEPNKEAAQIKDHVAFWKGVQVTE